MALFTDEYVSDVSDLIGYETNLPEVAAAEGVNLSAKLKLAHIEVGAQLQAASTRPGSVYQGQTGVWSSGGDANLSRFELEKVVVTPPLKLWHTFQTLAIVYRDLYNRKVNDKYLPKWNEYKELARWAADLLYQTGIGVTWNPLPRPDAPTVDWVSGTHPAATHFGAVTWGNAAGEESAGSTEQAVSAPDASALRVTHLTPPGAATHWNVYVGGVSGELTRQNPLPLPLFTPWVLPPSGLVQGSPPGEGQKPQMFRTVPRFLQRG
jgi:hypothetical protein